MKNNGIKIAVSAVTTVMLIAVIAVFGAAIGNSSNAGAQTAPASPQAQATTTPTAQQNQEKQYSDLYLQKLAASLGVSVDKLTTSLSQARKDVLAQAVTDGKLTQAQADTLNQNLDARAANGEYGFGFGFGAMGGKHGGMGEWGKGEGMIGDRATMDSINQAAIKAVADKLGITTAELTTALRGGQTLSALATSKNVTLDSIKAAVVAAVKPILDQAVKDSKLTQAQADSILQRYQNADYSKGLGFGGLGFGGPGFRGPGFGGRGGHGGNDNDNNQNAQPTPGTGNTN